MWGHGFACRHFIEPCVMIMCCLLQYMKPNSDVTVLGEMIFGSVAMAFQGTVLKVHSMKAPSRVMCTKVFHSPVTGTCNREVRY